ncbi:MAG: amino acid ABC transporter permease [Alphaproteobacteria bacterium]|nr:amino acid ABC transporter permease [Alphaproteobacteria bacterium]MBL6936531.1 amino acid ABC transporter permease [Alphaproteobacteria bacterium]MBL7098418.1 amino acid ABC transporter permease [Alphaproteobacteria bacterium]
MAERPRRAVWRDTHWRSIFAQALVLVALAGVAAWLVHNAADALTRRHVASGFGFLEHTAGFSISQTLIDYSEEMSYGRTLWVGLLNTLLVSAVSIVLSTILGFIVGIGRLSSNWLVAKLCTIYIETLRNIPLLLQILFWYFGVLQTLPVPRQSMTLGSWLVLNNRGVYVPEVVFGHGSWIVIATFLFGLAASFGLYRWAQHTQQRTGKRPVVGWAMPLLIIGLPVVATFALGHPFSLSWPELSGFQYQGGLSINPELAGMTTGLSIYTAAYIAEIVRAGLLSVARGQREAAEALGLPRQRVLWLVLIPQAMRVIIPPLASEYLSLTKNSSLAIAIGYPDLVSVFAGTVLNQTGQAIEILSITMAIYLALSLITSGLMNLYSYAHRLEGSA